MSCIVALQSRLTNQCLFLITSQRNTASTFTSEAQCTSHHNAAQRTIPYVTGHQIHVAFWHCDGPGVCVEEALVIELHTRRCVRTCSCLSLQHTS